MEDWPESSVRNYRMLATDAGYVSFPHEIDSPPFGGVDVGIFDDGKRWFDWRLRNSRACSGGAVAWCTFGSSLVFQFRGFHTEKTVDRLTILILVNTVQSQIIIAAILINIIQIGITRTSYQYFKCVTLQSNVSIISDHDNISRGIVVLYQYHQ